VKYSLRSLMIVAMLAPPLMAGGLKAVKFWNEFWHQQHQKKLRDELLNSPQGPHKYPRKKVGFWASDEVIRQPGGF